MELKSIHEIFNDRILRIPANQRGYSWANNKSIDKVKHGDIKKIKGQLIDLWGDILNIPDESWHYTGLLTLNKALKSDYEWLPKRKQYEIVDGQQRITSVLILITVMVEQADKLNMELGDREGDTQFQYLYIEKKGLHAYIFGYDQDNPSDKFFRKHILGLDEIEDDSLESVYTENLRKAKAFFEEMVQRHIAPTESTSKEEQQTRLQALFDRVTNDLRFNEYVLPSELDEFVVFETMNNRGKPLSELEKLKNRLMFLSDKFQIEETESPESKGVLTDAHKKDLNDAINRGWITIYQSLGANKKSPLEDDEFIKAHWISFFGRYNRSEASAHATHLFDEYFTLQQLYDKQLTPNHVREYVKSLQRSAVVWNKIHNPRFFDTTENKIKETVLGLCRVGFKTSFKPVVLSGLLRSEKNDFIDMIALLEQYAFKVFDVSARQSNTGDSKFYRLAYRVYKENLAANEVNGLIEAYTDEYYRFTFFQNKMQELFESGDKNGFYGWSGLHYFLFEYDQQLRKLHHTSTNASKLSWEDFNAKDTIEHIYPQSAAKSFAQFCDGKESRDKKASYEQLQNDWDAFRGYSTDQRKRLCNSLGNLLAISHSDNASLSNDPFSEKVDQSSKGEGYKSRGYKYDSMSAQMVAKNTEWTPEKIKERGLLMLKSLFKILGEPQNRLDEKESLKLLGLEFMIDSKARADTKALEEVVSD